MKRRFPWFGATGVLLLALSAYADDSEKTKEKTGEKKDAKAEDKVYTKPEPKALPEGPAKELSGPIALVKFDGIVNPGMGQFTVSSIERAQKEEAQAILIELDTPGGLVSTTQTIVQAMLTAKIPIIVHVTPSGAHAASAGTIITMAAHVAAMSPATRIGAAHPVTGSGQDPEKAGGEHMGRKIENDLAAMIEGIADERGRNAEWAIDAVRDSVSITEKKALEYGVVDLIAKDRDELFAAVDGRELDVDGVRVKLSTKGARVVEYELSFREQLMNMLASPGVSMILLLVAMLGIAIEMKMPGMIAPGVIGVLCAILFFVSMEQLPIDVGGAILVMAGVGLLIAELFTSTYGVLGILGLVGMGFGMMLLIDPDKPDFALDPSFKIQLVDVVPMLVVLGGIFFGLSAVVLRTRRHKPVTGSEGLVGEVAVVLKKIDNEGGMVLVNGEYWKARSRERIAEKEQVEVTSVNGLELEVRRRPPM